MAAIERTLSSPWRLVLLVLLVSTVLSWLSADQVRRAIEARMRSDEDVDFVVLFAPEFAHFLMWAAIAPGLLVWVRATWRRVPPLVFVVVQLATAFGVAWSMGWLEFHTTEFLRELRERREESRDQEPSGANLAVPNPFALGGPPPPGGRPPTEAQGESDALVPEDAAASVDAPDALVSGTAGATGGGAPDDPSAESGGRAGLDERLGARLGERLEERLEDRLEERFDGRFGERRDERGPRSERGPAWFERPRRFGQPANAVENAQRRLPRELLLYLLAMGLSGSAVAFLQQRRSERARLALEVAAANLQSELARSQLRSLRAQLQPHFLFNALHGIGGLVREGRDGEALTTLSDLGGLLRRTLDADRVERWSLATELALIDEYLSVEGVRLGDRLVVERSVAADCERAALPPLLLLPLVENAIRHGIASKPGRGTLRLVAQRHGERLRLVVEDDGPGYPPAVLAARRHPSRDEVHVGLANTVERLERLFPGRSSIELSNRASGGASVAVELPFET